MPKTAPNKPSSEDERTLKRAFAYRLLFAPNKPDMAAFAVFPLIALPLVPGRDDPLMCGTW